MYTVITSIVSNKQKQYDKLPVKNISEIYASIDINIPDNYVYNENTIFYIIDVENKKNDIYNIQPEYINNINEIHSISRGCYVYDLYKESCKNDSKKNEF